MACPMASPRAGSGRTAGGNYFRIGLALSNETTDTITISMVLIEPRNNMHTPATILIRAAGLDTMIVVQGVSPLALIRTLQSVPTGPSETLFYGIMTALGRLPGAKIALGEGLHPAAEYLFRVDEEKIIIRETTGLYALLPSWKKSAAPMLAIVPMAPGAEPTWVQGDPSLRSLAALEQFIDANPALGEAFSTALKQAARTARGSR